MFSKLDLKKFPMAFFVCVLMLNSLGAVLIWSATGGNGQIFNKLLMGMLIGVCLALLLSVADYHRVLMFSPIIYIGCILMLVAVLIYGHSANNATRWINIPFIGQLQPSEFVKVGVIVFFAWFFERFSHRINDFRIIFTSSMLLAGIVIFVFLEPDLSTSLVILFVFTAMLFAAGLSYRWIALAAAVVLPFSAVFFYLLNAGMVPLLKDYQIRRIMAFINPAEYVQANQQQNNSVMAVASGMLHGKGLNTSAIVSVKNGNFLSEQQTDFIFAILGEETGFTGCIFLILLLAALVFACLHLASQAKDLSGKMICTGMASLITFQSFVNIAVATGIMPNTGLPLPFVSYGLSSLLSLYIGTGMVLGVGMQRN